ncbi:DUF6896 domain-containing protein [Psychroserpens mesophilus]|uniref:DUF6896 domain-containing protein n=1 Tax=Psychroserpens mesophilus TaxID=325473 RepID=UPI00058F7DC4|nr:hypothetical protein [Psychroserpens mesophilus]
MIDKREKLILEALIEFEEQANKLIEMLANEFELNLENKDPFNKLITRSNNLWKGSINGKWNYQFHGDACRFENNESGQVVDIKINRNGNYGTIHNFGLLHFIETTQSLSHILKEINTDEIVFKTLAELERKEFIIEIDEPPFSTKILNRNKK